MGALGDSIPFLAYEPFDHLRNGQGVDCFSPVLPALQINELDLRQFQCLIQSCSAGFRESPFWVLQDKAVGLPGFWVVEVETPLPTAVSVLKT